MPLKLNSRTVNKSAGLPAWEQLANHLRQAIVSDDIKPGEALPSEKDIGDLVGISRQPVRKALDQLDHEGLIIKRKGWPTKVAERREPLVMGPSRYRSALTNARRGEALPAENPFTTEHGARWSAYTEDPREFAEETASPRDRELLKLAAKAKVWRRRFVRNLDGRPFEIVRSAIPLEMAAGTVLMSPEPSPGNASAILAQNGYDPQLIRHTLLGRPPNGRERELLKMESADWVWERLEVFTLRDGTPIQAAKTIMPITGNILEFETDLSD
jgi:GntR family transcriptional regulator